MSCYEQGTCTVPGCTNPKMFNGYQKISGRPTYKSRCQPHHVQHFAEKKGMKTTEWVKSFHPYHRYRKNYCENAKGTHAGWLGVPCSIVEFDEIFLQIDHLDGDHNNNDPENLMTLCPTCHMVKTWIFDCISHRN